MALVLFSSKIVYVQLPTVPAVVGCCRTLETCEYFRSLLQADEAAPVYSPCDQASLEVDVACRLPLFFHMWCSIQWVDRSFAVTSDSLAFTYKIETSTFNISKVAMRPQQTLQMRATNKHRKKIGAGFASMDSHRPDVQVELQDKESGRIWEAVSWDDSRGLGHIWTLPSLLRVT